MKTDDSKPAADAATQSALRHWTTSRLQSLTGSQVKTLLLVASESGLPSAGPPTGYADAERLLAEMSGEPDGSTAPLLERATKETTPIQELIRIKELSKLLAKEAADSRHRDAARLLYHVSVATAFVHHGVAISGRPMRKQQPMYEKLASMWAGHAIGDLFSRMAAGAAVE